MASYVPIIDIGPFIHGTCVEEKKRVAAIVDKAARGTGFFLIRNYESVLPRHLVKLIFSRMHDFFSLPADVKTKNAYIHARGYFTYGEENLTTVHPELNDAFVKKELGDFKEGYDIGREIGP